MYFIIEIRLAEFPYDEYQYAMSLKEKIGN